MKCEAHAKNFKLRQLNYVSFLLHTLNKKLNTLETL